MPITRPLIPKMITVGSMIRSRRAVSATCAALESGTIANNPRSTRNGAKIHIRVETTINTINTELTTPEASLQAPFWSLRVKKPVNIGINAEPSAPPAVRLKSSSVTRLAALKESRDTLVPKAFETTIPRTIPTIVLRK